MNPKPLGDRLIVIPIEPEDATLNGIVLPESAKEKPMRGMVVAVGPGPRNDNGDRMAMDMSPGDTVLYAKYAGTKFKEGDIEVLILRESDVFAIVEYAVTEKPPEPERWHRVDGKVMPGPK